MKNLIFKIPLENIILMAVFFAFLVYLAIDMFRGKEIKKDDKEKKKK